MYYLLSRKDNCSLVEAMKKPELLAAIESGRLKFLTHNDTWDTNPEYWEEGTAVILKGTMVVPEKRYSYDIK